MTHFCSKGPATVLSPSSSIAVSSVERCTGVSAPRLFVRRLVVMSDEEVVRIKVFLGGKGGGKVLKIDRLIYSSTPHLQVFVILVCKLFVLLPKFLHIVAIQRAEKSRRAQWLSTSGLMQSCLLKIHVITAGTGEIKKQEANNDSIKIRGINKLTC